MSRVLLMVLGALILASIVAVLGSPGAAQATARPGLTLFQVEDLDTLPAAINARGDVTGAFGDALGGLPDRGFIRDRSGGLTTFVVPAGCTCNASPADINDSGVVAGIYWDPGARGFIRFPSGEFVTFDAPNALPGTTYVSAINNRGDVAGQFFDATTLGAKGFVRERSGAFRIIDVPPDGIDFDTPLSLNNAGVVAGSLRGMEAGFLLTPAGQLTTFTVPDAFVTDPSDLLASGALAGTYIAPTGQFGFVRSPTGDVESVEIAGAEWVQVSSLTPSGVVGGWYLGTGQQVFMRHRDRSITTLDLSADARGEYLVDLNDRGVATGYAYTPDGVVAFLWSGVGEPSPSERGQAREPALASSFLPGVVSVVAEPGAERPTRPAIARHGWPDEARAFPPRLRDLA